MPIAPTQTAVAQPTAPSAGTYKGVNITPGSDVSIAQQMAKVDATQGTKPPTQPTVLTSQNIDQKNQQNVQKATQLGTATKGASADQEGFTVGPDGFYAEAPSNAKQVTDPSTGKNYFQDPVTGQKYATGPSLQDPYVDQLNQLKQQMDATGAANIEAIKQQYAGLIAQQQQFNKAAEAGVSSLLIRGGSSQTASSSGILQTQMSWGLQQISDFVAKESAGVIGAQQAMQQNDMELLDKMMTQVQKAKADRQAIAEKLADSITTARTQQRVDNLVDGLLTKGVTSSAEILANLKKQGIEGISAKQVSDSMNNLIGGPGVIGEYNLAKVQGYKGTLSDYQAAQAYREAYARASASVAAQDAAAGSSKHQSALENQGRNVILKEMSNRSGGLGLQDAKVNQGIHLRALLDQYKTVKTVQNTGSAGQSLPGTHQETVYNIPKSQYAELAMGLANLVSGSNVVSDSARNEILTRTAKGDIAGAVSYITGSPQSSNTNKVFNNLADSIDRQALTAEQERQTYLNNLVQLLPSDLAADRKQSLINGSQLNSYQTYKETGQMTGNPALMTPDQIDRTAYTKIQTWSQDPKNSALLMDLAKQFPNMSNVELAQKLGLMPSAQ